MIEHDEVEVTEPDSLTADLALAWDAAETDNGTESEGGSVHESYEQPSNTQGSGVGDGDASSVDQTGNEEELHRNENASGGIDSVTEESDKPPVGLSPEAREEWANVPPAVKDHIARNEQRMEGMAQKYGHNAKRAEAMDRSLAPYAQLFAMNGGPGETLPALLQTASQLQMGSGPQKAQAVANIIKQFGIDIKTLDNMLVGESPPQEVQQQSQIEQMLNQRLQPLQQQLGVYQQRDQQMAQQAQGQVANEVNTFGSQNEFYNDVRSDMADLLDMAANRGRKMSMQEAYNTACAAHPQISKVMQSRQSSKSVQQKRQAASSIYGTSGGSMAASAPNSVAAALNDAWDSAGRMQLVGVYFTVRPLFKQGSNSIQ